MNANVHLFPASIKLVKLQAGYNISSLISRSFCFIFFKIVSKPIVTVWLSTAAIIEKFFLRICSVVMNDV